MLGRQVLRRDRHHSAGGCEHYTIRRTPTFKAFPLLSEGRLVDMTVYPIAILEIEVDQAVNNVY